MATLIPISFHKVALGNSYASIILGNEAKKIAIYTQPELGEQLQMHLQNEFKPRPLTYELISSLLKGFEAKILQVVINNVEDSIFFARLYVEQTMGDKNVILEIDARPSDCIALAVQNNIPIFCRSDVFEKAIAYLD